MLTPPKTPCATLLPAKSADLQFESIYYYQATVMAKEEGCYWFPNDYILLVYDQYMSSHSDGVFLAV